MATKTVISTPFPTTYAVAKKLGVSKKRVTHLIHLMDSIRMSDAGQVTQGGGRYGTAGKKLTTKGKISRRKLLQLSSRRTRSRPR